MWYMTGNGTTLPTRYHAAAPPTFWHSSAKCDLKDSYVRFLFTRTTIMTDFTVAFHAAIAMVVTLDPGLMEIVGPSPRVNLVAVVVGSP